MTETTNIYKIAEGTLELSFPPKTTGAIKSMATKMGKTTRSISRAIHAKKSELSEANYTLIRITAIRDYNAFPVKTTRVRL